MTFKQLINPHSHSDSSLDGASTVKDIVKRNKELGATHVTLTEHGNMNSAMDLYSTAQTSGLKPILGIEAYMLNPYHDEYVALYRGAFAVGNLKLRAKEPEAVEREIQRKAMGHYLHVTIHFRDAWAYQYFCGLSKRMWERAIKKYDELKPLITLEELKGAAGHVTIGSSCMRGPVQYFLLPSKDGLIQPDQKRAEYMYNVLKEISGDGFFVEVFPHAVTHDWQRAQKDDSGRIVTEGFFKPNECTCHFPEGDMQKPLNQFVLGLADRNGDKALISLDSHFAKPEHKVIQDAKLGNGSEEWRFHENYYIMSSLEAAEKLKKTLGISDARVEKMIQDSYDWASLFNGFKIPTNKDRWILTGDAEGFLKRLKSTIDKYGRMNWEDKAMIDRLKYEINVLAHNGKINLLSYFAVIEDIANYCRENDILINVRGSAGGSLLLYLIGVSSVNPLKHGLSFERFLTEGRIKANTLPDADIDVSDQDKLIRYLNMKYGEGVCRVSTDLLLRIKMAIKDAERAMFGRVKPETEVLTKKLPSTPQGVNDKEFVFGYEDKVGVRHDGLLDVNPHLKKYAESNPETWKLVSQMLGIQRNKSTHACGFVITGDPVTNYVPVIKVNDEWVTGFSPKSVEAAGLPKFDLLGLNTLRDIQSCLRSIRERLGIKLIWNELPFDQKCFDAFGRGDTVTIFQFDSHVIRPFLIATKPQSIDDEAALTSLGRPGTLDAPNGDGRTLATVYVDRKKGEPIQYIHSDLAPITGDTMGIQLYQEQTLRIFRDIGGLSWEQAENVRRGIGKKDEKVLLESTTQLKEACLARGWTDEQVGLLIEQIMASSRYSFNKSHAVSYAYVAYACMYLKVNYPLDWWLAILSNSDKNEVAGKFWRHVKTFTVLPDINHSHNDYRIIGDKIIAPLSMLNNVGEKAYQQLIKHAPYESLEQFVRIHLAKRTKDDRSAVNIGVTRKLIAAGILDSMFPKGMITVDKLRMLEDVYAKVRDKKTDSVPEEYRIISDLGQYLLKKQIISVYSEDLRELLLPLRGGQKVSFKNKPDAMLWMTQDGKAVVDGVTIEWIKANVEENLGHVIHFMDKLVPNKTEYHDDNRYISAIGYVIQEKAFPYKNKSKQATDLIVDINGFFSDDRMWPAFGTDTAPTGFKGLPVLLQYKISDRGCQLIKVTPHLTKEDVERYDVR